MSYLCVFVLIFCIVAKLVLFFNKMSVIYVLISCFGMVNEALYPEMNPDDPFLFFVGCTLSVLWAVAISMCHIDAFTNNKQM